MVHFGNEWDEIMAGEFDLPYYKQLRDFLKQEYFTKEIYPDMNNIFNAMKHASYSDIKAVILGQDPYHEPGQAHGLCFSVQKGCPIPPSLQNIYKELNADLGIPPAPHGELYKWADNGVLLLNTVLTVRRGQANSHKGKGWENITTESVKKVNNVSTPVVFLLWGSQAQKFSEVLNNPNHLVLKCAHPSPLSAYNGFFGCNHFRIANGFLVKNGLTPIDWSTD